MPATGQVIGAAVAFVWLGMVLAVSFLETPLKFRAPGITLPLGVGIGRLVFRALNTVEVVLAVALITALLTITPGVAGWTLLVVTAALLATQTVLLRPRLDRRAQQIITGQPPPSRLHLIYIGLGCPKVATLIALGALLATTS
jgi:hypothetical protein